MPNRSSASDVLAVCCSCRGKSLPPRSCPGATAEVPDDLYNLSWRLCARDTLLLLMCPAGAKMLMLKWIVTCTWYCFQTFTHNGSHTSILSCTRSCTNDNLHEWFLSLKYAIRIHRKLERMDAGNVVAIKQDWQNNDSLYSHMYASTLVWNLHKCPKLTLTPLHDG
jgi:hypothetical protein